MTDERAGVLTGWVGWLSIGLVVASFLVAFWGIAQVPPGEEIPIHWNAAGEADGFGSRWTLLLTPAIGVFVVGLIAVIARVEPRQRNMQASLGPLRVLLVVMAALMFGLTVMITASGLGREVDVGAWMSVGVGLLIVIIGNLLGKIRPTFTFGVRTPWTLSSDLSWQKTHRLMGFSWVVLGSATAALGLFGFPEAAVWVLLIGLLASVVLGTVYSYYVWRDDPDKREE